MEGAHFLASLFRISLSKLLLLLGFFSDSGFSAEDHRQKLCVHTNLIKVGEDRFLVLHGLLQLRLQSLTQFLLLLFSLLSALLRLRKLGLNFLQFAVHGLVVIILLLKILFQLVDLLLEVLRIVLTFVLFSETLLIASDGLIELHDLY